MTEQNEQRNKTIKELEQEAGYPDISKANTKTVIVLSLIVVLFMFLLSIFVPTTSVQERLEEQTTTQDVNTSTETTSSESSSEAAKTSSEDAVPTLLDMSQEKTPVTSEVFSMPTFSSAVSGFQNINGKMYYLAEGETPFTGWLEIDNLRYYIQADGTLATGWQEIDGVTYYFAENGKMATSQWIEDKYVGTAGNLYKNTTTPEGIYVDATGTRDTSLGKMGSTEGLTPLRNTLEDMLSGYSGTWSVYVKDIENKEYLSINNTQMFSASLIKLYCALGAYHLIDEGKLEESERISSLMQQMISISDNDAFNLMVAECSGCNSQVAGRPIIQAYINAGGYRDTTITSMLLPTKYRSPSSPGRNYTTVEDCGLLLESIYKGQCVNASMSRKFLDLLLNQAHTNKIVAGLPEGTKCANKTGDTNEFQHDVAIVYSPGGDYILAIMSMNSGAAITNIEDISKAVYSYFN